MLHHIPATALQDEVFAEVARVLRPGGTFAGTDSIGTGWLFKTIHVGDILRPIDPDGLPRLRAAGLSAPASAAADARSASGHAGRAGHAGHAGRACRGRRAPPGRAGVTDVPPHIVDAARHVLAQDGLAAATLERISSAAGVSRMTLHRRGVSKADIVRAIADRARAGLPRLDVAGARGAGHRTGAPGDRLDALCAR